MKEEDLPKKGIVPSQEHGRHTSAEAHVDCGTREEAISLYLEARKKLLDINHWDEYAGAGSAIFTLTDASGFPVDHSPEMGDLIRIKISGPGNPSGEGYDWVVIEEYIETIDRQRDNDLFAFRVRPTQAPDSKDEAPSHFFTEESTSTFLIQRAGLKVTAAEKGRNEIPNLGADGIAGKLRNAGVGIMASLGLSVPQWKSLMSGILKKEQ